MPNQYHPMTKSCPCKLLLASVLHSSHRKTPAIHHKKHTGRNLQEDLKGQQKTAVTQNPNISPPHQPPSMVLQLSPSRTTSHLSWYCAYHQEALRVTVMLSHTSKELTTLRTEKVQPLPPVLGIAFDTSVKEVTELYGAVVLYGAKVFLTELQV